jgi:hypothetical protein
VHTELDGWLPRQFERTGNRVLCRWFYAGATPLAAPFYEETVLRCMALKENSAGPPMVTDLDVVLARAAGISAIEPAAFLFHVSRCGSTLVSQLWSEDPAFVALSEVPLIDQILRARFQTEFADAVNVESLLPATLRLLGQRRIGPEKHLLVKLDSWHIAFHAEFRALFPRTPFILIYRHPAPVFRSLSRMPGQHAVPGLIEPAVFGWGTESFVPSTPNQSARVLQSYYENFLRVARGDRLSLLVAYEGGMLQAMEAIAFLTGITYSPRHRALMLNRIRYDAKRPDREFVPSLESDPLSPEIPPACVAAYEALERRRAEHPPN